MTKNEIKDFVFKVMKDTIDDDVGRIRKYSGRAMYGKQCVGIDTDLNPASVGMYVLKNIAIEIFDKVNGNDDSANFDFSESIEYIYDFLKNARTDSMGLGTIVYWPSFEWKDEWKEHHYDDEDNENE